MARLPDPLLAERRRRQIMDAAVACFRRRGFHQATMAEICTEADISAGALYRYFGSKTEIIAAIAEDKRDEGDTTFTRTAEREGLIEALVLSARGFFDKIAEGDSALIAEIISEGIRDDAIGAHLKQIDRRSVMVMVEAIKAAQRRGEVDSTLDPTISAETLFAAIEGIGLRRAFQRTTAAEEAVAQFRTLAERFLRPVHEQA